MMLFWTIVVALIVQCCLCVPLESFYPFGANQGDLTVSSIDGSASFMLSEDFTLSRLVTLKVQGYCSRGTHLFA